MTERDKAGASDSLRKLLETIKITEVLAKPYDGSIATMLEVSTRAVGSDGASVLLPKGDDGDLVFRWASGRVADSLIGVSVPAGKGIAGFVFSTGQPMVISDAEQEGSFYAEVDRDTGFSTHTILATPLQFGNEVIGVLEYVNRPGDPPHEPFTPEEMDLAAFYAESIASFVHSLSTAEMLGSVSNAILNSAEGGEGVSDLLEELEGGRENKDLVKLSLLIRDIAAGGQPERDLAVGLLESIRDYLRSTRG